LKSDNNPIRELFGHLKAGGLTQMPESLFATEEAPEQGGKVSTAPAAAVVGEERESLWAALIEETSKCTKCRLCETRNKVVLDTGCRIDPPIAFIGEGPGADEDLQGEPFVGKAGQLLTKAIEQGLGLKRSDIYICNVVKCRPPNNRAPLPDEVENCITYLFRQIDLVNPRVIITLGQSAQMALCGKDGGITKIRGTWLEWRGRKVMPTFHPAYLLRNPSAKRPFWEDLQEVMRELGIENTGNRSGPG